MAYHVILYFRKRFERFATANPCDQKLSSILVHVIGQNEQRRLFHTVGKWFYFICFIQHVCLSGCVCPSVNKISDLRLFDLMMQRFAWI